MSEWTVKHIEHLAARLAEDLNESLELIAENRGRLSAVGWKNIFVEEMSDAEISMFLGGLRAAVMAQATWLDEVIVPSLPVEEEGAVRAMICRHDVKPNQIDQEIAGAEGECFHRRAPERHMFPEHLRMFNEALRRIREFRVYLSDEHRKSDGSIEAREFSHTWYSSGAFSEVSDFLRKMAFTGRGDGSRDARERVSMEHHALLQLISRVAEAYYKRLVVAPI